MVTALVPTCCRLQVMYLSKMTTGCLDDNSYVVNATQVRESAILVQLSRQRFLEACGAYVFGRRLPKADCPLSPSAPLCLLSVA